MRSFNKLFVISLPRCATVSMGEALGQLGVPVAHLGHIFGEGGDQHFHPQRLQRMLEQINRGDYALEILQDCRGLADYPACSLDVIRGLDRAFPGSLFVNVKRTHLARWLQSVERQFVGLDLISQHPGFSNQGFMQTVAAFRRMTFGRAEFDALAFRNAYENYQSEVDDFFANRRDVLLTFDDVSELANSGFTRLCDFLQIPRVKSSFPANNSHSQRPARCFMDALAAGQIRSQTGISG